MRRADQLVAPSKFLRDEFDDVGPPITIIPNVLRLERYTFRAGKVLRPAMVSVARPPEPAPVGSTSTAERGASAEPDSDELVAGRE